MISSWIVFRPTFINQQRVINEEDGGSNSLEGPMGCVGTRRRGSHLLGKYVLEGGYLLFITVSDTYDFSHVLSYSR